MSGITKPVPEVATKRCRYPSQGGCARVLPLTDFGPKRNEAGEVIGYAIKCKECTNRRWRANRDGLPPPDCTLTEDGRPIALAVSTAFKNNSERALEYIKFNRSLQGCADYIGVTKTTLKRWLNDPRDAYQEWARRFRIERDKAHKHPLVDRMFELATEEGSERAAEFLLKTGWREEFGDKKDMDLTVRQGPTQIDESKYTVEELEQLQQLLAKNSE